MAIDAACGECYLIEDRVRPAIMTSPRLLFASLVVSALVLAPLEARAQPAQPAEANPEADAEASPAAITDVALDEAVAKALYERGRVLLSSGDYANAKMLFIESLERSFSGPVSADAKLMLQTANERLGLEDLDAGLPQPGATDDGLLDPYGQSPPEEPLDAYPAAEPEIQPEPAPLAAAGLSADEAWRAQRGLMLYGGLLGFTAGLAMVGPYDDEDNVRGGAVLSGLIGAGAGAGAAYYLSRERPMTVGQAWAVGSGGVWGGVLGGFFADLVTGIDTTSVNDVYRGIGIGSLVGTGAGAYYALAARPSRNDLALTNSLGMYGGLGALLLSVAMDPATGEAYSLNAVFGAVGGLSIGLWASTKLDISRQRMLRIDLGALAGAAAPWILLYPVIADYSTDSDERTVGLVSAASLFGGAYLAWRYTSDMDAGQPQAGEAPMGLLHRSSDGAWMVGLPNVRPAALPALDARTRGYAVDVLGGHF